MIEVTRVYIGTGLVTKVMLNPRYIKTIEPLSSEHKYYEVAKTLIVMGSNEEDRLIYVEDPYTTVRYRVRRQN